MTNMSSRKKRPNIYLDYASATPVEERVLKLATKTAAKYFANASAIHELGLETKKVIDTARQDVANILGAHSNEIIFTSGATESNNLAILGSLNTKNPHIVTTHIEHASVLELCKFLEHTQQAEVTFVPVESNGIVDPRKIKKALKENTVLVSVMYANNEIGTIQPIKEIVKEIRHFNKNTNKKILFHTDATQATNYLLMHVEKLGVDMMSLNAAKIYGPKGVGVLFKKRNVTLLPLVHGGDQEFGLRAGTEDVVGIVSLAEALKIADAMKDKESKRLTTLRDYFFKQLAAFDGVVINGDIRVRLPNNINITIPNIPSDLLVIELSARGISASAKSACKSGDGKSSHVIEAINPTLKDTDGSLRFSLGRQTSKKDINDTIRALKEILTKLNKWYH